MSDWNSSHTDFSPNNKVPYSATKQNPAVDTPVNQSGSANTAAPGNIVSDTAFGGQDDNPRVLARQIGNSAQRGTQTITGQTIVNDPTTTNPVITTSGPNQNQIFSDPTTQTPRVIEGLLPDNTYGLWVSKPGIDATTAGPEQLAFNSNQNSLKIVKIVEGSFTSPPVTGVSNAFAYATAVNTIPHGLDFIPIPFGTFFDGITYIQLPDTKLNFSSPNSPSWIQFRVSTDSTYVYLSTFSMTYNLTLVNSVNFAAKIYLLQETAN